MMQPKQILRDRYQLNQQLGQNAGRQTWLAEDLQTETKEKVIIKLLAFSPQMQWEELKLFEREAQVLQNLDRWYTPKYRDYFTLDKEISYDLPWFGLVQDYISGSSLRDLLEQGKRFNQLEAREIAKQVLNILIYLHELSPPIIHRDIKPSNLILGSDGQVYLVDFGAVQDKAKAEGVTFTVVGTNGYAPPEQLWGKAIPNSDLYALGATLIHLLTGIAPSELPQRQMQIEFKDKVKLNPNFANWLEKLTQPASERRFNSAREALEALQETCNSQTDVQIARISVDYVRLGFLSLCGSLLGGLVLSTIVIELFKDYNHHKVNQRQAKEYVSKMNKYQQYYYEENGKFIAKNSVKGWEDLGIEINPGTVDYKYSFTSKEKVSYSYAIAKSDRLKSYIGAVFVVPDTYLGETLDIILCEANKTGKIVPAKPIYKNGVIACASGTNEVLNDKGN